MKNIIKLFDSDPIDITLEEFDEVAVNYPWKHNGKTGLEDEPFRHWAINDADFLKNDDFVNKMWSKVNDQLKHQGYNLERKKTLLNRYDFGDSSWAHTDTHDYTIILYLNPFWNVNWGGETLFFAESKDKILYAVYPKGGTFVLFSGKILHKPNSPSREAIIPRIGLTFQCDVIT